MNGCRICSLTFRSKRKGTVHAPLLRHLARVFQWKDDALLMELEKGFDLTGQLIAGEGWKQRTDDRYANPAPHSTFLRENLAYVQRKLASGKLDKHWKQLLDEIIEHVKSGRMEGLCSGPQEWIARTIPVGHNSLTSQLRQGPASHQPTSCAFAIEQIDGRLKVIDGEKIGDEATTMRRWPQLTHLQPTDQTHLQRWPGGYISMVARQPSGGLIRSRHRSNFQLPIHTKHMRYCAFQEVTRCGAATASSLAAPAVSRGTPGLQTS